MAPAPGTPAVDAKGGDFLRDAVQQALRALQHTNISAARKTRALPTEFLGNTLELGRLGGRIGRGIDWERRHAGSTHDEEREDLEHFADFVSEPASGKMIV